MDISGMMGLYSVIKLAIIFGLGGIAFSFLLLIWPDGVGNLSRVVNPSFDIYTVPRIIRPDGLELSNRSWVQGSL